MRDQASTAADSCELNTSIGKKREILLSIFNFSRMVNRLLASFEAIKYLNESHFKLPVQIARFYRSIYGRYKLDSSLRIEQNLAEIEGRIQSDLNAIIKLCRLDAQEFSRYHELRQEKNQSSAPDLLETAALFKRRVQTALCLRLILKERGVSQAKAQMHVPEEVLEKNIAYLAEKEEQSVNKTIEQMSTFLDDIDFVLNTQGTDAIRDEYLSQMRAGLILNLKHLQDGHSIDDLPYAFEQVTEATDKESETSGVGQEQKRVIPVSKNIPAVAQAPVIYTHAAKTPVLPVAKMQDDCTPGFFYKLWHWLNSPCGVSWKNIRRK